MSGDRVGAADPTRRASGARTRRRLIAATVATVLLAEAAVAGGALLVRSRSTGESPAPSGVASERAPRAAALRGLDWVDAALEEQAALVAGRVWAPFVGAGVRDLQGDSINVEHWVRRSYETPLATRQEPVDVWFFGGSTVLGTDLQRDEHTIPSEVVRLAEQDGVAIRARNYGQAGFVSFQEGLLLALALGAGDRPDLVVFYDGSNDVAAALQSAVSELNPTGEPGTLDADRMRSVLAGAAGTPVRVAEPPQPLGLRPTVEPPTAAGIVDDAVAVYRQSIDLVAALAAQGDFEVVHLWQHDFSTKEPLDPGEREAIHATGYDDEHIELMRILSARLRATLPDEVIDLSGALDDVEGPVLVDLVHTNEAGARAAAEAVYDAIHPALVRAGERS